MILLVGVVILIYCYFGGLLAVASADVLSFLIIIPVAVLIVPLILFKLAAIGAVGELFSTPANFSRTRGQEHPGRADHDLFRADVAGEQHPLLQHQPDCPALLERAG